MLTWGLPVLTILALGALHLADRSKKRPRRTPGKKSDSPRTSPASPFPFDTPMRSSESSSLEPSTEGSASSFLRMDRDELRRRIPTLTSHDELQGAAFALARHLDPSDEDLRLFLQVLSRAKEEKLVCTLLWALGMREDRLPTDAIQSYLQGDERPDVRRAALRAIGTHRDSRIAALLATSAESDRDPAVRGEAVFYLTLQPGSDDTERRCVEALAREADPEVRSRWVNLLGTPKTDTARQVVRNVLYSSSEPEGVRRWNRWPSPGIRT